MQCFKGIDLRRRLFLRLGEEGNTKKKKKKGRAVWVYLCNSHAPFFPLSFFSFLFILQSLIIKFVWMMSAPFEFSWEWLPLANEGCQPYAQPLLLALSAAVGAAALFLIIRVKRSLSKRKEAKQLGTQSPPTKNQTSISLSLSLWCGLLASCKTSVLSLSLSL